MHSSTLFHKTYLTLCLYIQSFLENTAHPLLEGCASFLLDWLIKGQGDLLETNPSTSPEHYFIGPDGKKASVSYSTTMDIAIIKEVFLIVLSSAEVNNLCLCSCACTNVFVWTLYCSAIKYIFSSSFS